jgi:hypothetical protein
LKILQRWEEVRRGELRGSVKLKREEVEEVK